MNPWLASFLDLIFPRVCTSCEGALVQGEEILCASCLFHLPRTNSHQTQDARIAEKFYGKVELASAHAYLKFTKGGRVQHVLHALKYKNQPEVGNFLGKAYGTELQRSGYCPDAHLIIPVPLHRSKFRQRQYNQSDCFAEGLSEALQVPWSGMVLQKRKASTSQTRKSRFERFQNVDDVFQVIDPERIRGQNLILVDDIVTTGATLESAARTLLHSGARTVHILTIATAL